jgi:A/G-specific adenine glycosylase
MQNPSKSSWIHCESSKLDFRQSLLAWFDTHQRDLPWRRNPSLYKTVVSEFMLQQTRVSTVIPYFENWMIQFPNFMTLANAKEEKILKAWEGLGYYSRARNLHKLSKIAAAWTKPPQSIAEWKKLPGVGPYIAAAVTSISLSKANAVCDGNVVRVLSRLFAIREIFRDGASAQKKLLPHAQQLICANRPGDYNQGIMEIGATICHRSSPLCALCPLLNRCVSGQRGDYDHFPQIKPKAKKTAQVRRYWVEHKGKLLLYASTKTRLVGVYQLPDSLPIKETGKEKGLSTELLAVRKRTIGQVEYEEEIVRLKQGLDLPSLLPVGYAWMDWSDMKSFTLSGPHRKWISEFRQSVRSLVGEDQGNNYGKGAE